MGWAIDLKDAFKSSSDATSGGTADQRADLASQGQRGIQNYFATGGSSLSANAGSLPGWVWYVAAGLAALGVLAWLKRRKH